MIYGNNGYQMHLDYKENEWTRWLLQFWGLDTKVRMAKAMQIV